VLFVAPTFCAIAIFSYNALVFMPASAKLDVGDIVGPVAVNAIEELGICCVNWLLLDVGIAAIYLFAMLAISGDIVLNRHSSPSFGS